MPVDALLSAVFALSAPMMSTGPSVEPPNVPADAKIGTASPTLTISYDGKTLFSGKFEVMGRADAWREAKLTTHSDKGARGEVTQKISIEAPKDATIRLVGDVYGSDEAFPAESDPSIQDRFKFVRNSIGLSSNLRNNAVYDRRRDWSIEGLETQHTEIKPSVHGGKTEFSWKSSGHEVVLTFRPRFYQKHKNITYFEPWKYDVWKGSVAGWCSWWAYFANVREEDVHAITDVFARKLRDFGYDTIQIDDGYQSNNGGLPKDWLTTDNRFPSGLENLSKSISAKGLKPALWLNVHFGDQKYVEEHPNWFIQDTNGKPHKGPWIDYGLDGSVKEAVDTVVRPTYQALHKMGWEYLKVDALRHLLYDATYPCRAYFAKKGGAPEEAYRDYLKAIRQEIGPSTYMLACWGVLPETVGIANGCRLGGDGFGPSTLQQYTSWNNVVWRNDPDHCDIKPNDHQGKPVDGEERIRPVLVSMAGAQLLLSDKPDVYENDANLEGVKRACPILFTVPGQLYDYDPVKTDNLKKGLRNTEGGALSGPIDADQAGEVCPWWMLDINEPYESWTVLTHMNWHAEPMNQSEVKFADLGLAPAKYSVFEFWSKKYLGDFEGSFLAKALDGKGLSTYAIRRTLDRPQILSTSRHISQGAAELSAVSWGDSTLSGSSHVVGGDPYSIYVRLPAGYDVSSASFGHDRAEIRVEDHSAEIKFVPERTESVHWHVTFTKA